jgi:hypothetical protein
LPAPGREAAKYRFVRVYLARFFCGEAAKKCAKMINLTKKVSAIALPYCLSRVYPVQFFCAFRGEAARVLPGKD